MPSISAVETRSPKVAVYHYIRNMTRRRIFVALYLVLCLSFWQAMKRSFSEEHHVRPKELNPGRSGSALGFPRRCVAGTEDSLAALESLPWFSRVILNIAKHQDTEKLTDQGSSERNEKKSELILDREFTKKVPEDETWTQKDTMKGIMGKQSRRSLQSRQDNHHNQVKHVRQQREPSQVTMDSTKEKSSEQSALRTTFPAHSEFVALNSVADTLPDVIYIPFEAATANVTLTGWEDEWLSKAEYDVERWGNLSEPKIDFVYSWVNGSDKAFTDTMYPYEVNSTLNDPEGKWLQAHRMNRYRDWDELRFSIRTVEKYAQNIRNKIQILVNSVGTEGIANTASPETPAKITGKQIPLWLENNENTTDIVQIIPHEDFFDDSAQGCLPTFNSLTIENQIFNTKSAVDRFFALSDDMLLGKLHAASDLYSPLFGPMMGFKDKGYNTRKAPTDSDAHRFGERPYHIYTSWLLNRRFGERHRDGPVHFGHSMGRSVTHEAIESFPRPALQSACQRFRGQADFQLSTWFATFHYTIERHREVLLWSYITQRSDTNQDGYLGWNERQAILADLEEGMSNEGNTTFRTRQFYRVAKSLEAVGLEAPKVNLDILWTSLDGPSAIRRIKCHDFNVTDCMGPGFSAESSDKYYANPIFSTEAIFHRVTKQKPECGDCLLKLILKRVEKGLETLLPHKDSQVGARAIVIKALVRYQYTIVEPDALFLMVTDAEQVEHVLTKRLLHDKREVGQLCVNDDIATDEVYFVEKLRQKIHGLFQGLVPEQSQFERKM